MIERRGSRTPSKANRPFWLLGISHMVAIAVGAAGMALAVSDHPGLWEKLEPRSASSAFGLQGVPPTTAPKILPRSVETTLPPASTTTAPTTSTTVKRNLAPTTTTTKPKLETPAPVKTKATPAPKVGVLAGKVVAIDPGHDGGNGAHPSIINQPVSNGRGTETEGCDTAGAVAINGYPEHEFTFNVATDLAAILRSQGATVVLTRTTDTGVGPCVPERAAIGNNAHANVAISIHADGGPATGRGFTVLEPVASGVNNSIVGPSEVFAGDLVRDFSQVMPVSNYDGIGGVKPRDDLGGLNLSTVPKVMIECGNMQNPSDVALLTSSTWQEQAAGAMDAAIVTDLTAH